MWLFLTSLATTKNICSDTDCMLASLAAAKVWACPPATWPCAPVKRHVRLLLQVSSWSAAELRERLASLQPQMEQEMEEIRQRYQAKRKPILDAIQAKKGRQQHHFWVEGEWGDNHDGVLPSFLHARSSAAGAEDFGWIFFLFYFGILEVLWNFQVWKKIVFHIVKVSVFVFCFLTCGTTWLWYLHPFSCSVHSLWSLIRSKQLLVFYLFPFVLISFQNALNLESLGNMMQALWLFGFTLCRFVQQHHQLIILKIIIVNNDNDDSVWIP